MISIPNQRSNAAVVGLGKIGLPLALQFASSGFDVVGCDVNQVTVDLINEGYEPFPGEKDLLGKLRSSIDRGALRATTNIPSAVASAETIIVVVPLYVNEHGEPDFSAIDSATEAVASSIGPETLVIYETTLPIGTTRNRIAPILEHSSGLKIGEDIFLAYSPERVYSGRIFEDLRQYPKLVGGMEIESAARAVTFYEKALQFNDRDDLVRKNGVWNLGSCEAAEFAKLAETTYRDVNIGLANEFATHAESLGVDVYQVIEACNSQPFSHIHQPGIAVGGHCIPVYPQLYLSSDHSAEIVRTARSVNRRTPNRILSLISDVVGALQNQTVLILGISYRGGVKETFMSGVFELSDSLLQKGAEVTVFDPIYTDDEIREIGLVPGNLESDPDLVIIQNDHTDFRGLDLSIFAHAKLIFDGRNILSESGDARVLTIGRG